MTRQSRSFLISLVLLSVSLLVLGSGLSLPKFLPQVREIIAPSGGARTESAKSPAPAVNVPVKRKAAATVRTDKREYQPGEIVVITGSGWQAGESVEIALHANVSPARADRTLYSTADTTGHVFNDGFSLGEQDRGVRFVVTATGGTTRRTARTAFGPEAVASPNANEAADLDQCANGGVGDPPVPCTGTAWQNGNVNQNQGHYLEGDSIPYRMRFTDLTVASANTVTIEWDTTQGGKHAIDYLTSYDRTESSGNNPCSDVTGCSLATFTTFPIPTDPNVSGAGVTQIAGNFTLFGGTITAVSAYTLSGSYSGNSSTSITITFTADVDNPVLAWGGHIASRADWGASNSAVAIPGSPYHTRLLDLNGSGGNQDRALAAGAVIFPASITIVKDATPNGSTSFPFTASPSPLTNFSLVDDGTSANTKLFSGIVDFTTYTVEETPIPPGWNFGTITCGVTSPNGGSATPSGAQVTIDLHEGENWSCTYTDAQHTPTPTNTPTNTPTFTPTNTPTQHADEHADQYAHEYADEYAHEYAHEHADQYADVHADEYADQYADEHAHEYADEHADQHADEHADEYAHEHADQYADEYADEHADEYADEYPDQHADEHADEYGDQHADEHADQHADEHADRPDAR